MLDSYVIQGCGTEQIDAFCAESECSLVYGTSHFMGLISRETSAVPYWLIVKERERIEGALPLLVKHARLGPVVNSLAYYGSNGGAIVRGGSLSAKVAAVSTYESFCKSVGAVSSTLITNPLLDDSDFYEERLPHDLRDERIGQFTFFPADRDPTTLLKQFCDPRPRNIRKAQQERVSVKSMRTPEAIEFLYSTHRDNMSAIGGPAKRPEFFRALPHCLPNDSWNVFVASKQGEWIAALLLLYFNRTVEYFTPCIVERHRSSQGLSLLIYEAMLEALSRGFSRWNWGGTWLSQEGVYNFKKKWGTTDMRYFYYTRLFDPSLRCATRAQIEAEYPGFYVLPFSSLAKERTHQEGP